MVQVNKQTNKKSGIPQFRRKIVSTTKIRFSLYVNLDAWFTKEEKKKKNEQILKATEILMGGPS